MSVLGLCMSDYICVCICLSLYDCLKISNSVWNVELYISYASVLFLVCLCTLESYFLSVKML